MNGNKSSIDSIIEFLLKGPLSSDSGNCGGCIRDIHVGVHVCTHTL